MTLGSARPMEDAARIAYRELTRWLVSDFGFEESEAYFLLTQAGRVRLGNMVDPKYTLGASILEALSRAREGLAMTEDRKSRDEAVIRVACLQMEPRVGQNGQCREERRAHRGGGAERRPTGRPAGAVQLGLCVREQRRGIRALRAGPGRRDRPDLGPSRARPQPPHLGRHLRARGRPPLQLGRLHRPRGPDRHLPQGASVGRRSLFFEPGNLGFPVLRTPIGRIGAPICYDCWFPEGYRLGALQGAESSASRPTGCRSPARTRSARRWPTSSSWPRPTPTRSSSPPPTASAPSAASPSSARASIVSQTGWPVAGPASPTEEEIIVARVNLADARRKRNWNAFNQVLRDRAPDVYDEMLGSPQRPGWY